MRKLKFLGFTAIIFSLSTFSLGAVDLTLEELKAFNGKNGQMAYMAVDGVIYDVTNSKAWKDGEHIPTEGRLKAGIDATDIIIKSPHGKKVLKELPVVGKLIQ